MTAKLKLYTHNFMNKAILTINTQDTFVTFATFDAFHGHSQKIYVRIAKLAAWIEDDDQDHFEDRDLHSSIRLYRRGDTLHMELVSLRENDGDIKGFVHRFSLDPDWLAYVLTTRYEEHKTLITIRERNAQARLALPAHILTHLRQLDPDRKVRRAFVKAISRNFMYGSGSAVRVLADYDGFFFEEFVSGKRRLCGGLIISKMLVDGKDGRKHEAFIFSLHT